ncbi:MAG: hypothetical protein U1G07_02645 [Verrucomicrobiota bacterium]
MKPLPRLWPILALGSYAAFALIILIHVAPRLCLSSRPEPAAEDSSTAQGDALRNVLAQAGQHGTGAVLFLLAQIRQEEQAIAVLPDGRTGAGFRERQRARLAAYQALTSSSGLDAQAEALLPVLLGGLVDSDRELRRAVVVVLLRMRNVNVVAVPALVSALQSPEGDADDITLSVQQGAAYLLGKIGPSAILAVPELLRLVDDHNVVTSAEAAIAVWLITHDPDLIRPRIDNMLNESSATPQIVARVILRRIGPHLETALAQADRTNCPHADPSPLPEPEGGDADQ